VSPTAIALIVVAAAAHANWNLFSKQAATTGAVYFIWLFSAWITVGYAPVVAVAVILGRPHLTGLNWLFMVGTGVLQAAYFLFLQIGYSRGDLSVVYPVGRGTGAMLAAVGGVVVFGERPGALTAAGIAAIIAGVVLIGLPGRPSAGTPSQAPGEAAARIWPAIGYAVATGAFIASYTLWDKYAVTTLRTPSILQGYACFPVIVTVLGPLALRGRNRLAEVWRSFRPQVLGAALLAPRSARSRPRGRSACCSACCSAGGCSARATSSGG
jgi:drug/metabolite transporter (DMT)-like permease